MVVVKIQRPGVREIIVKDLEALEEITEFIDAHTEMGKRYEFSNMLGELRQSLLRELDFKKRGRQPAPVAEYPARVRAANYS